MKAFSYERAASVDEALEMVARPGAKFIAGGTNLLDLMKLGIEAPVHLVDINRLGLDTIEPTEDGGLRIDGPSRQASLDGVPLSLTMREFDLLRFFVGHPGVAFTRVELLEKVWGWSFGDQSTVTVHVRRLREKVEKDPTSPARLQTVWGVGYRWERAR